METEILFYEDVGDWGITLASFAKMLPEKGKNCSVRINSYGGDAFQGLAMSSLLRSRNATVFVDGIAASAATPMLCTAKRVVMARGAMVMLHNPWSIAMGDAEDMIHEAEILDKLADSYASLYAEKTGKSVEEMRTLMKSEAWLTADEAVLLGIADEIDQGLAMAASAPKTIFVARKEATMDLFNRERVAQLETQNAEAIARIAALEAVANDLTMERDAAVSRLASEKDALVQAHRAEIEAVRLAAIEEGKQLATGAILKANAPEVVALEPDDETAPIVETHSAKWSALYKTDKKAASAYFDQYQNQIMRGK